MRVYLDSSVVLRKLLGEPGRLRKRRWASIERGVASALVEVECLRTLDRLRIGRRLGRARLVEARTTLFALLEALEVVEVSRPVLGRASAPFPVPLGTLDAIHLSTALAYRDLRHQQLAFATHDERLGAAARAMGLEVWGC